MSRGGESRGAVRPRLRERFDGPEGPARRQGRQPRRDDQPRACPVPPGLHHHAPRPAAPTSSRGACPTALADEVDDAPRAPRGEDGPRLGDPADPLLVSVRSGAKFSMPGMMETVLNVGLNDAAVAGLAAARPATSGSPATPTAGCCRCSARPCSASRATLLRRRARRGARTARGVSDDLDLDVDDLRDARRRPSRRSIEEHAGADFPQDPREQLDLAILAVFDSWNTDRARALPPPGADPRRPRHRGQRPGHGLRQPAATTPAPASPSPATRPPASQGVYGDYLPERPGRGRRRRHPQHRVAWPTSSGIDPTSLRRAARRSCATLEAPLPRPVRHRVHRRARQAVDAADPGRQAHRRGGVPDRRPAGRRGPDRRWTRRCCGSPATSWRS